VLPTLGRPAYCGDSMRTPSALSRTNLAHPLRSVLGCFLMTKKEIGEYFAKFGRMGGRAAAAKMTPEQRKASARKAAQARWAKAKQKQTT